MTGPYMRGIMVEVEGSVSRPWVPSEAPVLSVAFEEGIVDLILNCSDITFKVW